MHGKLAIIGWIAHGVQNIYNIKASNKKIKNNLNTHVLLAIF